MIRPMALGAMTAAVCLGIAVAAMALPATLVDRGERATALVDVDTAEGRGFGSAFCINEKGIFVTDGHVVAGSTGKIKLVIRPGEKDQRVLIAQVLGIDYEADMALLQTENPGHVLTLQLGDSDGVVPTADITAFGYPFGNMLALDKDSYPSISVNSGKVTALRKQKGDLGLIQLDALVNPGDSGGPVMDAEGKVIGIVESGVPGAGVNFATPVAKLKKMMQGPLVVLDPVSVDYANRNKPQKFSIRVASLSAHDLSYDVTFQIGAAKGATQSVSGKTVAGKCDLMIAPTTDTAAIKWNPFTEAPPSFKFILTLQDSRKQIVTQQGTLFMANVPLAVETGSPPARSTKANPMDPLPADAVETAVIGVGKGAELREVNAKKQLALGVRYTTGQTNGKTVIGLVQLVYKSGPGGQKMQAIMAREGYVVGGLVVDASLFVYGFKVIFIRQKDGKLDPTDTYTSDWAGNAYTGKSKQLAGNGERVIGICGRKGIYSRAIGLVVVKPAGSPTTQPAKN